MTQENNGLILFKSKDGEIHLDAQLEKETLWLTQAQLCALFNRDQSVISRHVRNVFKEGELSEKSNMQKMHIGGSFCGSRIKTS